MNQFYPKHKQWATGTRSYPCRLYAKSREREIRRRDRKRAFAGGIRMENKK